MIICTQVDITAGPLQSIAWSIKYIDSVPGTLWCCRPVVRAAIGRTGNKRCSSNEVNLLHYWLDHLQAILSIIFFLDYRAGSDSILTLSLTAKVIYDLDFLNKDCSKSSEAKNFWEF
jgi:hypothetical protein